MAAMIAAICGCFTDPPCALGALDAVGTNRASREAG